jgi:hypothetical protein
MTQVCHEIVGQEMDDATQPDLRQTICDAVSHVMANPGLPADQRMDSRPHATRQPSISEPDSEFMEREQVSVMARVLHAVALSTLGRYEFELCPVTDRAGSCHGISGKESQARNGHDHYPGRILRNPCRHLYRNSAGDADRLTVSGRQTRSPAPAGPTAPGMETGRRRGGGCGSRASSRP